MGIREQRITQFQNDGDERVTTYAAFFDGITVLTKASDEQEFIERVNPVLERFEVEVEEADAFPYDEKEEGGWGDDGEQSLVAFLKERGISLNGNGRRVVVLIEDEVEGIEVIVA